VWRLDEVSLRLSGFRFEQGSLARIARNYMSIGRTNMKLDGVITKSDEKSGPLITPLTRRRIVAELDRVPSLSGELPEIEFLKKLWPIDTMPSPYLGGSEHTMEAYLIRHRLANDDMSNKDVLEALGIHTCPQKQFFRLLEAMLYPLIREVPEQSEPRCSPEWPSCP
jgi:hypothetical protein